MADMDTHHISHRSTTLPLSVELIQAIGSNMETPLDLLNFACICKQVHSAIDTVEMAKKDAKFQQDITGSSKGVTFTSRSGQYSYLELNRPRPTEYKHASLPNPSLMFAIQNGKGIEEIKQHINIYRQYFPRGLEGWWYPNIKALDRRDLLTFCHSPVFRAAEVGRLDIVQVLFESGVDMRGRCSCDRPGSYAFDITGCKGFGIRCQDLLSPSLYTNDRLKAIWSPRERFIGGDNAFAAACMYGHQDVAQFMVLNGLKVRPCDIYVALDFGCYQVIETLLRHPVFNTNARQDIVLILLELAINDDSLKDPGVISFVLDIIGAENKSFDKAEWARPLTVRCLGYWNLRLAPFLFDICTKSGKAPFDGANVVRVAACSDKHLGIIKTVFSGDPWSISESERSEVLGDMTNTAMSHHSMGVLRYLRDLGQKFTPTHLKHAIMDPDIALIDEIIASGVSISSNMEDPEFETPLHFAMSRGFNISFLYDIVERLIHHGADYENVPEALKDLLAVNMQYPMQGKDEMRDTVAQLILGENYEKEVQERPYKMDERLRQTIEDLEWHRVIMYDSDSGSSSSSGEIA